MKRLFFLLIGSLLVINGCRKNAVETDLSVTSSDEIIVWEDEADLMSQIDQSISFNYNGLPEDDTYTYIRINEDTSSVVAKIEIKDELKKKFVDPNQRNNSVIIELYKEENVSIDGGIPSASSNDYCTFYEDLYLDLATFDFANQSTFCVPITIHHHPSVSFDPIHLNNQISKMNDKFAPAKIQFQVTSIKLLTDPDFINLNLDVTSNFSTDVPNTLNMYLSKTLKVNGIPHRGFAHFPLDGIQRIYLVSKWLRPDKDANAYVLCHETGHFFSLYHTFETALDGCSVRGVRRCEIFDDGICDTPIDDQNYGFVCNPLNNNLDIIVDNYMSYSFSGLTLRSCNRYFVQEQNIRMRYIASEFKSNLQCNSYYSSISLSGNINFGNVPINTPSSVQTLTISNTGTTSFFVNNITSTNPAFTILNGQTTQVQPNGTLSILIQFNPTLEQNYTGFIQVDNTADNANSSNSTIQVQGVGIDNSSASVISLSGNLNFGNVNTGSYTSKTLTISNTGTNPFTVSGISAPTGFSANWSGTVAPGGSQNVQVQFQPTQVLSYTGNIVVNSNADSGTNTMACSGNGVNNQGNSVISISGNLNFGNVTVGNTDSKSFTISNTGTAAFTVSGISFPYGVYSSSYAGGTIQAGSSQTVTVTFSPVNVVPYNGNIVVNHNADMGSGILSVTGSGVTNNNQPNLAYYELDIDFDDNGNGIVEAGEDIDLDIRLQNIGNAIATGVEAIISTNDADINITDNDRNYIDINAGSLEWNSGSFDFDVSPNCPTKTVNFDIQINSNEGTWVDNFTIQIVGGSSGQPNLIYKAFDIQYDDNGNGFVEAGEDIDFDIQLENIGSGTATGIEAIISTNDPDINITDSDRNYSNMTSGAIEWNSGAFDFDVSSNCPTKSVPFNIQINSNEGSWTDNFNILVLAPSTPSITPSNTCSSAPLLQLNTEYDVNINVANYGLASPIHGNSYGGNDIRGFWVKFQEPTGFVGPIDIKVYAVSSNFDPVIGHKFSCGGIYYTQWNQNTYVANLGSYGGSETFADYSNNNGYTHYVRIYHFYGHETPNISFKIKLEN